MHRYQDRCRRGRGRADTAGRAEPTGPGLHPQPGRGLERQQQRALPQYGQRRDLVAAGHRSMRDRVADAHQHRRLRYLRDGSRPAAAFRRCGNDVPDRGRPRIRRFHRRSRRRRDQRFDGAARRALPHPRRRRPLDQSGHLIQSAICVRSPGSTPMRSQIRRYRPSNEGRRSRRAGQWLGGRPAAVSCVLLRRQGPRSHHVDLRRHGSKRWRSLDGRRARPAPIECSPSHSSGMTLGSSRVSVGEGSSGLLVWTRTASPRPTSIRPAGTACGGRRRGRQVVIAEE